MNKKIIVGMLWAGFAVKAVYLVLMLAVILAQQLFKPLYSNVYQDLPFYFPAGTFLSALAAAAGMLICCIVITNTLKKESKSIVMEIIGMVLFCGLFSLISGLVSLFTERLVYQMLAPSGMESIASRNIVLSMVGLFAPLSHIGTALYLFGSGMAAAYKKSLSRI